ncbi:pentapeptide repeat-containing protein [Carbonactinospora thermoautotrophica]|uniref:pentapeptide repeat-containing protein n=1 Tax=Carbonactinospora thermoautotrophica TaxID=1469144 RepID=UPI00082C723F|nr:pentapeptide repeat-containing protein [Carbonactinospora thermoautotrophica]
MGGIYALERIMHDSPRDHATIVEVLAAFVREHAPVSGSKISPTAAALSGQWLHPPTGADPTPRIDGEEAREPRPATDVQAALSALARRPPRAERPLLVDLHQTDLRGANLHEARLSGARLEDADLSGAQLGARTCPVLKVRPRSS